MSYLFDQVGPCICQAVIQMLKEQRLHLTLNRLVAIVLTFATSADHDQVRYPVSIFLTSYTPIPV